MFTFLLTFPSCKKLNLLQVKTDSLFSPLWQIGHNQKSLFILFPLVVFPLSLLFTVHFDDCTLCLLIQHFLTSAVYETPGTLESLSYSLLSYKLQILCILRQHSRPVAGASLFTELSLQFVFIWSRVIERRSLIMESNTPPSAPHFCSFNPFTGPPSLRFAAVFVLLDLLSI